MASKDIVAKKQAEIGAAESNGGPSEKRDAASRIASLIVPAEEVGKLSGPRAYSKLEVERPHKEIFFRCSPDPAHQVVVWGYKFHELGLHIIDPRENLHEKVLGCRQFRLRLYVTAQMVPGIWPLNVDPVDKAPNRYNQSATLIAKRSETEWLRIEADTDKGEFFCQPLLVEHIEPEFPKRPFFEQIDEGFEGKIISDFNDARLKRLRGEAPPV